MNNNKLFSQHYFGDNTRYEDKPKFRLRILKCLEDFTNANHPQLIYLKCRSQMGLDIEKTTTVSPRYKTIYQNTYHVEKLFAEKPITDILDFIGTCFNALAPNQNNNQHLKESLKRFVQEINLIFREESMCYVLHDDGQVRYYPDEEFHQLINAL